MKILKAMHQGDVLFLKVDDLGNEYHKKAQLKLEQGKGLVIHHGEALGHYHRVPTTDLSGIIGYDMGEQDNVKQMALVVTEPTAVVHEEHGTLTLDEGYWIARTQKESFKGVSRRIVD